MTRSSTSTSAPTTCCSPTTRSIFVDWPWVSLGRCVDRPRALPVQRGDPGRRRPGGDQPHPPLARRRGPGGADRGGRRPSPATGSRPAARPSSPACRRCASSSAAPGWPRSLARTTYRLAPDSAANPQQRRSRGPPGPSWRITGCLEVTRPVIGQFPVGPRGEMSGSLTNYWRVARFEAVGAALVSSMSAYARFTPARSRGRDVPPPEVDANAVSWRTSSPRSSGSRRTRRLACATRASSPRSRRRSAPSARLPPPVTPRRPTSAPGGLAQARQGREQGRHPQEPGRQQEVGDGQAGCCALRLTPAFDGADPPGYGAVGVPGACVDGLRVSRSWMWRR